MNSDSLSSPCDPSRRAFLKTASLAGLALGAAGVSLRAQSAPARHRYALVGTGVRSRMFQDAIEKTFAEHAELVGLCDKNPGRLQVAARRSVENGATAPRTYVADDFDRMIRELRPQTLIVTTVDATHDEYVVRAMEAGLDVITEKSMTTTAEKAARIIETQKRTGRRCRVTFNYRYSPPRTQVKDLLMSGEIGDVLSVDFHWLLNTDHGADYFRRWHSEKKNSGGLMVHKATHHFDLVNWWIAGVPQTVFATGKRDFYTPHTARRMGLSGAHERCLTCPEKAKCGFYVDLAKSRSHRELYLEQEHYDGYFRDRCVFRPGIDIEDTMNVVVGYDTGATLSYSLNAFNAWEGYHIAFNGTKGRLEHTVVEKIYVNGREQEQGGIEDGGVTTRIIPLRGAPVTVKPWVGAGDHGGGDKVMLRDIFDPGAPADKYLRATDQRAGVASIIIGAAANLSMAQGRPMQIPDLLPTLERPDYAPMPTHEGPVPMPPQRA